MKRGQSSLEYMVMLALSLAIFTTILYVVSTLISTSSTQIGTDSAHRAVSEIKEAVDFVYVHGDPSKIQVNVYVPPNIVEATIQANRVVNLRVDSTPSYTDIYAYVRGNISGDLSRINHEGYYVITVESAGPGAATLTVE